MVDEHARLEMFCRDISSDHVQETLRTAAAITCAFLFPHARLTQPDTAERKRLEMQAIPFALPEKTNV